MQTRQAIFMAVATGAAGFALGVALTLSGTFNNAATRTTQPPAPAVAADAAMPAGVHLRGAATNNDGDTMRLTVGGDIFKIRLWGVDAPESKQSCTLNRREIACGKLAGDALAQLIEGREVGCKLKPSATFDRFAAVCFAGGKELNREMVRQGWAIDEKDFSDGFYSAVETYARDAKAGIWAMKFDQPAHWRACHKQLRKGQERPADCGLE